MDAPSTPSSMVADVPLTPSMMDVIEGDFQRSFPLAAIHHTDEDRPFSDNEMKQLFPDDTMIRPQERAEIVVKNHLDVFDISIVIVSEAGEQEATCVLGHILLPDNRFKTTVTRAGGSFEFDIRLKPLVKDGTVAYHRWNFRLSTENQLESLKFRCLLIECFHIAQLGGHLKVHVHSQRNDSTAEAIQRFGVYMPATDWDICTLVNQHDLNPKRVSALNPPGDVVIAHKVMKRSGSWAGSEGPFLRERRWPWMEISR